MKELSRLRGRLHGFSHETFLLCAVILWVGVACGASDERTFGEVQIGAVVVPVEISDSEVERALGLGGRTELELGTGMLFVPDHDQYHGAFWMKGMLISLDFVWVGEGCRVVTILQNARSLPEGTPDWQLDLFTSAKPSIYVLELNGGDVAALGIGVGDLMVVRGADESRCPDDSRCGPTLRGCDG